MSLLSNKCSRALSSGQRAGPAARPPRAPLAARRTRTVAARGAAEDALKGLDPATAAQLQEAMKDPAMQQKMQVGRVACRGRGTAAVRSTRAHGCFHQTPPPMQTAPPHPHRRNPPAGHAGGHAAPRGAAADGADGGDDAEPGAAEAHGGAADRPRAQGDV
jgi:hypothetical protein